MSTNSIFFIVLACFALTLLIVVFILINRGRGRLTHALMGGYVNDQIYIGNLSYEVDETLLREYFSRFGVVEAIRIVRHFQTGRSKGYAFLTYAHSKQAMKALVAHGKDLEGRSMVVRIAKPRPAGEQPYAMRSGAFGTETRN
jgi:hypothetical protein